MAILKRVSGVGYVFGGDEHSGWLPPGASTPLPTPVRRVTLDLAIEFDGSGYLLIYVAREDEHLYADYWFESLAQAEEAAEERFGIRPDQWQDA